MSPHELKHLHVVRNDLLKELDSEKLNQSKSGRRVAELYYQLTEIEKQIEQAGATVKITEHALLRYVERVLGVNLEEIEKSIKDACESQLPQGHSQGECTVSTKSGRAVAVVKENTVITILVK